MEHDRKLVFLRFDGDLDAAGFRATVELARQGRAAIGGSKGTLPPNPLLRKCLNQWQVTYRNGIGTTRLAAGKTRRDSAFESLVAGIPLEKVEAVAQTLKAEFQSWLHAPGFSQVQAFLREELHLEDDVQVMIHTDNSHLQHMPWHDWDFITRYHYAEIVLSPLSFKYISPPREKRSQRPKVKILAVVGNNDGINTAIDCEQLNALSDVTVIFLKQPTAKELYDHLWYGSWDIFFFAGHSFSHGDEGFFHLNSTESIRLNDLKGALREAIGRGLHLAIFNSCDGLGLACSLEQLNIPQMIVMREPIPDKVAQIFLHQFLTSFSQGYPFHLAVRIARTYLQSMDKQFPCATWLPIIFQNPGALSPTWADLRDYKPGNNDDFKTNISRPQAMKQHLGTQYQSSSSGIYDEATQWRKIQEAERLKAISQTVKICDKITRNKPGHVEAWGSVWLAEMFDPDNPNTPIQLVPGDRVHVVKRLGGTLLIAPGESNSNSDFLFPYNLPIKDRQFSESVLTLLKKLITENQAFFYIMLTMFGFCIALFI